MCVDILFLKCSVLRNICFKIRKREKGINRDKNITFISLLSQINIALYFFIVMQYVFSLLHFRYACMNFDTLILHNYLCRVINIGVIICVFIYTFVYLLYIYLLPSYTLLNINVCQSTYVIYSYHFNYTVTFT